MATQMRKKELYLKIQKEEEKERKERESKERKGNYGGSETELRLERRGDVWYKDRRIMVFQAKAIKQYVQSEKKGESMYVKVYLFGGMVSGFILERESTYVHK